MLFWIQDEGLLSRFNELFQQLRAADGLSHVTAALTEKCERLGLQRVANELEQARWQLQHLQRPGSSHTVIYSVNIASLRRDDLPHAVRRLLWSRSILKRNLQPNGP